MNKLKDYIESYVTFDKPIPYCGLMIYPILVKNWLDFMSAYDILNIEKNKIPDIQVIQMSYLQFMFQLIINGEDTKYLNKFIAILGLCFHVEYDENVLNNEFSANEILCTQEDDNLVFFINGYDVKFILQDNRITLIIKGQKINSTEFDDIIKIIMFQNFADYDDEPMSDDFKEVIQKFYSLKNKGLKRLTVEDRMVALMSQLKYNKVEIMDMTYRCFSLVFDSMVSKLDYLIGSIAQTQGYKEDVEHWVYKKDKQKYADAFGDAEAFKNKIESI